MYRAYTDINYGENADLFLESPSSSLLARYVFANVHDYHTERGENVIAVALPDLGHVETGHHGGVRGALDRIRLFGPEDALEALLDRDHFKRLADSGLIQKPRIDRLDDSVAEARTAYVRDRHAEKKTRGRIYRDERRLARRARQRGETRDTETMIRKRLEETETATRNAHVVVPMESRSTGQTYPIVIDRFTPERDHTEFGELTSFGLSTNRAPLVLPAF